MAQQLISGMYLGDLITSFIDFWGTDTEMMLVKLPSAPFIVGLQLCGDLSRRQRNKEFYLIL